MTRDDIIRMARKAGFMPVTENPDPEGGGWYECFEQEIEYFASLVAAAERERLLSTDIHSCHADCQRFACVQTRRAVEAEREACAKVCENIGDYDENVDEYYSDIYATAIRARGENK
jgi:hypothetical protein